MIQIIVDMISDLLCYLGFHNYIEHEGFQICCNDNCNKKSY